MQFAVAKLTRGIEYPNCNAPRVAESMDRRAKDTRTFPEGVGLRGLVESDPQAEGSQKEGGSECQA